MTTTIGIVRRPRQLRQSGPMFVFNVGVSFDPATTAWVTAVVANGGSVSANSKKFVDALISGLKTDGLFTKLDRLWLFANADIQAAQALTDIINDKSATAINSPTLAAGGYTGDGSTSYINTGYNTSTNGVAYVQDSASMGCYVRTSSTSINCIWGSSNAQNAYCQTQNNTNFTYQINGGVPGTPTSANIQGFWVGTRTSSSSISAYNFKTQNTPIDTTAATSAGVDNVNAYVLARDDGTPSNFSAAQVAAAFWGGALNSTDAHNLSIRLNTYMTSLGVNIY